MAPVISTALVNWSGTPLLPSFYMTMISFCSLAALFWSTSTKGRAYLMKETGVAEGEEGFAKLSELSDMGSEGGGGSSSGVSDGGGEMMVSGEHVDAGEEDIDGRI